MFRHSKGRIIIVEFQFNFNLQFQSFTNLISINFNFETKLYVKTRLVSKICKKPDLPSAHDLYPF
jgi:hypothetical protein